MSITTKIVVLHINIRQLELFRYSNSKSLQSLSICQIIFRNRPRDWEKSNFTQNYSIERKQNASKKVNQSIILSKQVKQLDFRNDKTFCKEIENIQNQIASKLKQKCKEQRRIHPTFVRSKQCNPIFPFLILICFFI